MEIRLRKMIYKVPVLHRLCMKAVDISNAIFYKKYTHDNPQIDIYESLKGSEKGKRCFIVGNGPSLTVHDLEMIKGEKCFAANLIFNIFSETEWRPTYYFLQDRYADTRDAVDKMNVKYMFIGDYYWRKRGMKNPKALCLRVSRFFDYDHPKFSDDISKGVYGTRTVTYTMIQVAAYIGFDTIYLLGMDHSYALTCDSSGKVIENKNVNSHFFKDRNPGEVIADVEAMNKAYIAAREYCNERNIKIYNATRGGKLEWFPRITLEEVLANE